MASIGVDNHEGKLFIGEVLSNQVVLTCGQGELMSILHAAMGWICLSQDISTFSQSFVISAVKARILNFQ